MTPSKPEKIPFTGNELIRGPKGVAHAYLGDEGLYVNFFHLPGPTTTEEADRLAEDYLYGEDASPRGGPYFQDGVWTGFSPKWMRSHSKTISEEIGRPVLLTATKAFAKANSYDPDKVNW